MKKLFTVLGSLLLAAVVAVTAFFVIPRSEMYDKHKKFRQSFGILTYETLNCSMNDKEREKAEPVFKEVKKAIAYSGSKAECDLDESLFPLCRFTDDYDYTTNQCEVKQITYTQVFGTGYLWVEYTRMCKNEAGETVNGASEVLCLVKVKDSDGGFKITDVVIEP